MRVVCVFLQAKKSKPVWLPKAGYLTQCTKLHVDGVCERRAIKAMDTSNASA